MPTKQNKKKPHQKTQDHSNKRSASADTTHDELNDSEEVIEAIADHVEDEADRGSTSDHAESAQNSSNEESMHAKHDEEADEHKDEVKIEFPYSELVRAYVPKAMDVAEKVATDWKKDGSFMNLGIDNPYANMAVSLGLKKAKELEKKLDEKGVLSVVRMGVEVIKQQVNKKK